MYRVKSSKRAPREIGTMVTATGAMIYRMRDAALVVAAVVAVLVAATHSDSKPAVAAFPGSNGRIAFTSARASALRASLLLRAVMSECVPMTRRGRPSAARLMTWPRSRIHL